MRRSLAGALPGVARARQHVPVGEAFGGDDALERGEPVMVIGFAGVGIAGGLRLFDLVAERRRPFLPGEKSAFVERQRQRERLRLPRRAEYRPFGIAGNALHGLRRAERSCTGAHAGSRYGSNASIDTFREGSALSPHNSRPSNSTV